MNSVIDDIRANERTALGRTTPVLLDVAAERSRQVARYGHNDDLQDGTGPRTAWLLPVAAHPATEIEQIFRGDYEDYEEETGKPTWAHLVREEIAEAFQEADPERLREELIQVAALAVSWVETLDARTAEQGNETGSWGSEA